MILLPVLYEKDGKQLVLSIGVYIEAKKLLKMFVFLLKSVTNLPTLDFMKKQRKTKLTLCTIEKMEAATAEQDSLPLA